MNKVEKQSAVAILALGLVSLVGCGGSENKMSEEAVQIKSLKQIEMCLQSAKAPAEKEACRKM
jgi:hypothetical protein